MNPIPHQCALPTPALHKKAMDGLCRHIETKRILSHWAQESLSFCNACVFGVSAARYGRIGKTRKYCRSQAVLRMEQDMIVELADYQPRLNDNRRRKTPPCFRCGNHLYGNHSKKLVNTNDNHERTFHKSCAETELKENPSNWVEV